MIDWVTAKVPLEQFAQVGLHEIGTDINTGEVYHEKHRPMPLQGSYETRIHVRTDLEEKGPVAMIQGNPAKWYQGHNVWGTSDPELIYRFVADVCGILDLRTSRELISQATVSRIDLTASDRLADQKQVLAYLAHRHRHGTIVDAMEKNMRGIFDLYGIKWNPTSRYWNGREYAKGIEIKTKGHRLSNKLDPEIRREIEKSAIGLSRREFKVRLPQLERLELRRVGDLTQDKLEQAYAFHDSRIRIASEARMNSQEIIELPRSVRAIYIEWATGIDPRQTRSDRTFRRHRKYLIDNYGVDIATPVTAKGETAKVIPLHRTLEVVPESVPEWAQRAGIIWQSEAGVK